MARMNLLKGEVTDRDENENGFDIEKNDDDDEGNDDEDNDDD